MQDKVWRIQMLGRLCAAQPGREITRFRTQKTGALLAYLAYYAERSHPRDLLIEVLWPDQDVDAARNSLRVALTSLRHQLEPPPLPAGSVLIADRSQVRLNAEVCVTDVTQFDAALRAAEQADAPAERIRHLTAAADLYQGDLLPGAYEEWVAVERTRLRDAYLATLRQLIKALALTKEYDRALDYAQRALREDALNESYHRDLMRLYAASGRPAAALSHYHTLERILKEQANRAPSESTARLARELAAIATPGEAGRQAVRIAAPTMESVPPADPAPPAAFLPTFSVAPPIRSHPPDAPVGLPPQFSPFYGREEEIARLVELITSTTDDGRRTTDDDIGGPWSVVRGQDSRLTPHASRLVTLTGPGGSGKTRLAIRVAEEIRRRTGLAVRFAPLADLVDPAGIVGAIGGALHLPPLAETDPLDQLVGALSTQPTLLVLDNFEQLLAEPEPPSTAANGDSEPVDATSIIYSLLLRVPTLTILITSRQVLEIEGEIDFPVPPLPIPTKPGTPERLLEFASVQLYVNRAQARRPDFQVTRANASTIAALCDRLEGIPLAIELAAAWSKTLTPAQTLEQLSRRFDLLVSKRRDLPPRHRTLYAAVESSYRLLSPDLQRFFARLSVFRGGWTLEAADHVGYRVSGVGDRVNADAVPPYTLYPTPYILEMTAALQDRSLILTDREEPDAEETRFRMLETLREYAADQLDESERADASRQHFDYFLALAETADGHLDGPEQQVWLDRVEAEHDNMRAALEYCLKSKDEVNDQNLHPLSFILHPSEAGLRLAGALGTFWSIRGYVGEGRRWIDSFLAEGERAPAGVRARSHRAYAVLAKTQGDYHRAEEHYEIALRLYREIGDDLKVAKVLRTYYEVATWRRDYPPAKAMLEESLALCRAANDKAGIADSLRCLGNLTRDTRQFGPSEALFEESMALYRERGDQGGLAILLADYGYLLDWQREYDRARRLFEEALDLQRRLKNRFGVAHMLWLLGNVAVHQNDLPRAASYYEESLAIHRELGARQNVIWVLGSLGHLMIMLERYGEARSMFEERLALGRETGDRPSNIQSLGFLGEIAIRQNDLVAVRGYYGERLALARTTGDSGDIAQALADLGFYYIAQGDAARARSAIEESLNTVRGDLASRVVHHAIAAAGLLAADLSRGESAARLIGAVSGRREAIHSNLVPPSYVGYEDRVAALRTGLSEEVFARAQHEGAQMSLEDTISLALESIT